MGPVTIGVEGTVPITTTIKEHLAKRTAETLLGLVLLGLLLVAGLVDSLLPLDLIEWLGSLVIGRILLALVLVIAAIIAWLVYLHPRFVYDGKSGTYIDSRTSIRYCAMCRVEKRVNAPMVQLSATTRRMWKCVVCRNVFDEPPGQPPEPPTEPTNWKAV